MSDLIPKAIYIGDDELCEKYLREAYQNITEVELLRSPIRAEKRSALEILQYLIEELPNIIIVDSENNDMRIFDWLMLWRSVQDLNKTCFCLLVKQDAKKTQPQIFKVFERMLRPLIFSKSDDYLEAAYNTLYISLGIDGNRPEYA